MSARPVDLPPELLAELSALLSGLPEPLPEIINPQQLGALLGKSTDQLANERYLRVGPPYVKYGSKVYYLRRDVFAFLEANRVDPAQGKR